MAGGRGGAWELYQTPTWAVAMVCTVIIVVVSILLQKGILMVNEHFFHQRKKKAVVEALDQKIEGGNKTDQPLFMNHEWRNMQNPEGAIRILEDVFKCSSYEGVKQLSAQIETQDIRESERIKYDNVLSLDQLERNVEGLNEKVKKLVDQGKSKVVESSSTRGYLLMPTNLAGETTTHKTLEKIWDCLMDDDVRKIGVYGMGGIGKTTIMKHINNCLLEDKNGKFDKVIWVTVSKTPNIVKLQNDVAQRLGFDLSKYKDMTIRVLILYNALRDMRRYVMILDDMWDGIPLSEIGIPDPTWKNECKLVLTTRTLDVCNFMRTDKSIQVGFLSEEEALNLFLDHVGRDILLIYGLKPIVEDVSKKCACLPLAIVIVARSMAGKKKRHEWTTALRKLRSKSKYPEDKAKDVIEQLIFSYEILESRELQLCLLYCALYPEDHEIPVQEMIKLLIDVGIIDQDMPTRQDQMDEGLNMFTALKNVCFLEGEGSEKYVKMHDLVRDMALQIARDRFMVEAGLGLKELPKEKNWSKNLMEVSLMENNIEEFPSNVSPECPKLSVLLLQENIFTDIPNSFFKHMLGIKVLNLSSTYIEILPNSVSNLVNLEALILSQCIELRPVPSLAMMKNLRRLDLAESYKLDELPHGLEELTDLKYLDLSGLELEIPHGILPKLSQLQYLVTTGGIVMKEEVMRLKKLEYFCGRLLNIKSFNEYFNHIDLQGGLVEYYITVGMDYPGFNKSEYQKRVTLVESQFSKRGDVEKCNISKTGDVDDLLMLPTDIQCLIIDSNTSISSLCDVASLDNVTDLRSCWISGCDKIEVLISSPCSVMLPLKSLEDLDIQFMSRLRELIERETIELRPLPTSTFSSLKRIIIWFCSQIEEVFPIGLIPYLQSLEEIRILNCEKVVNIVGGTSITSNNITLPNLRILMLFSLPELKSICPSPHLMVCNSLEEIYVGDTPKLKRIPISLPLDNQGQPCPLPSLREIRMSEEDWERMEWAHPTAKTILKRFHESQNM